MKSVTGVELLRTLGSGVLPPGVESRAGGSATIDRMGFAELLSKARSGVMESGIPVRVASGAGVTLSEEQLERLQSAADVAESEGATRALVFIDGMALRMDVHDRTVLGEANLSDGGIVTDIDSVISLPGKNSGADAPAGIVPPPGRGVLGLTPDVLEALGKLQK